MNKIKKILDKYWMSLLFIYIICMVVLVVSTTLFNCFFTGSEHTIENKIVDAWYTGESIRLNQIDHWWVTIEFEDGIPQMYFFKSNTIFVDDGKQKANNAWDKIEPLIGSEVVLDYYVESNQNGLNYFKEVIKTPVKINDVKK